ncbi:hypothetical protein J2T08_003584 [Neorhizobium galegae]|uniref:hypothetical protein n=1 Tax=Neorhizobium galegae TaxID=399 RepID=UPI002789F80E|nr:hypothetical protein [Neorhizobium galegae]MDQ0135663.1 hypothetical protein [Neorhizobium galegae]
MIQKGLIIACAVLLLALVGVGLAFHWRGQTIETLTAEKALAKRQLDEVNADLEQSEKNHNRIVQEKDALLAAELARALAERTLAVRMAEIKKDIDNAPESSAVRDSAPFTALFDGLRLLEGEGDRDGANSSLPVAGPAGAAAPDPGNAEAAPKGRGR